jgi:hypothetical protein
VLKKFFGLEAFITIQPTQGDPGLPIEYTCQAYLHLPTKFASLDIVPEEDEALVRAHAAQIISPEIFQDLRPCDKACFTRALDELDLDVDVHPMSFTPEIDSSERGSSRRDSRKHEKRSRAEALNAAQWPKRIQVMKMAYTTY